MLPVRNGGCIHFRIIDRPALPGSTGEALRIESTTDRRLADGLAPRQIDRQAMPDARLLF